MIIDLDSALKFASLLLSIAAIIFTFFSTRRKDVDVRFKTGSDRMDRHEIRLMSIEQTIKALPGKDDVHQLQLAMARMGGQLGEIRAVMDGNGQIMTRLEKVVTRHEDHLLGGKQ